MLLMGFQSRLSSAYFELKLDFCNASRRLFKNLTASIYSIAAVDLLEIVRI